jgi:Phosphopantetheine attachment site
MRRTPDCTRSWSATRSGTRSGQWIENRHPAGIGTASRAPRKSACPTSTRRGPTSGRPRASRHQLTRLPTAVGGLSALGTAQAGRRHGTPCYPLSTVSRARYPPPSEKHAGRPPAALGHATDEWLADIWRLLLLADGTDNDLSRARFFALGGNFQLAARLMFRIQEVFGVELRMAAFYEAPTLAACAATIDDARTETARIKTAAPTGRPDRGRSERIGRGAV